MSADIIPLPPSGPTPPAKITSMPAPAAPSEDDVVGKLLKNPILLAGGALLAGVALTRLFSTPSVRKLAQDLAQEAMKRAKSETAGATGAAAPADSLLEKGIGALRPHVVEAAKSFLVTILNKPMPGRRD